VAPTPLAVLEGAIVPHAGAQAVPFCVRVHVTPRFEGSLATLAVKVWVTPSGISALSGVSEVFTASTTMPAVFDAPVLNTEVAVMVTGGSLAGGVAGAVYVVAAPLAVAVGETVPQGAGSHETDHVTPLLFGSLATLATICAVPPASTSLVLCESMETVVPGTTKFTTPNTAVSVTDVAVIDTSRFPVGIVVGAV
jgi:hypothetical protein